MKDFEFIEVDDQLGLKNTTSLENKGFELIEKENIRRKYYYETDNKTLKNNKNEPIKKLHKLNLGYIEVTDENTFVIKNVIYDSKINSWKLNYYENGKLKCDTIHNNISKKRLESIVKNGLNETKYSEILKKSSISLMMALFYFDKKHNTNYIDEYLKENENYKIIYDLYNINNSKLTYREKINIYKEAKNQQKCRNVSIKNPSKLFLLKPIISLGLIFGLINALPSKTKDSVLDDEPKNQVESNQEDVVVSNKDNIVVENDSTKIVINDKTSKTKETLRLDDKLLLDGVELSNTALEKERVVNTDNLNCDSYKVSAIAVTYYNQILDVKKTSDNSLDVLSMVSDYKDKFGEDISIYLNFDGYNANEMVYHNIGWGDLNNINSSNKKQQMLLEIVKTNLKSIDVNKEKVKK